MSGDNKMSDVRATNWSVTINNPTEKDDEEIAIARQRGWKVEGQLEVGELGTPHYQLHVKTPQLRPAAVKKVLTRAHIEVAKSPKALAAYVQKEETRLAPLPTSQDQYPSLSKLWELMYLWLRDVKGVLLYDDEADKFCCRGDYMMSLVDDRPVRRPNLSILDEFICDMIKSGYYVESMGINPQIRGAWNSYMLPILERTGMQIKRRCPNVDTQTDRQTADNTAELSLPISHNNASQEASL